MKQKLPAKNRIGSLPAILILSPLGSCSVPSFIYILDLPNHIGLVWAALAKNSRERGWVHSGGGFGRMFRIAWYSAMLY
jgi:hypothetical protein